MAGIVSVELLSDKLLSSNMKRQREEDIGAACAVQAAPAFMYQSPLRAAPQRTPWAAVAASQGHDRHITPTKRQRDRSVPMDAMSRLMSAATSASRMKKRAQMTLTSLFGGAAAAPKQEEAKGHCTVCATAKTVKAVRHALPLMELQRCTHCERVMGPCCASECARCASAFCSNCSTINCDEQYDRVFCLSCHYDLSR